MSLKAHCGEYRRAFLSYQVAVITRGGMKIRRFLCNVILTVLALIMIGAAGRTLLWLYTAYRLPMATAADVGLEWQECELTAADADIPNRELIERCFGHAWKPFNEADRANHAVNDNGLRTLTIGDDLYTTVTQRFATPTWRRLYFWHTLDLSGRGTLYKNGQAIKTLYSSFQPFSSDLSLQLIDGKAVWEFADQRATTIIADGQDLRRTAGLHKAYRPYRLADKLIFVGKRFGHYLVIYDGRQIGPLFDDVPIAYCCEGPLYALNMGGGSYLFRGKRAGRTYLVEVTALALNPKG